MYGVDVARTRADDLDKKMLAYIGEHPGCTALDLGAGSGGQAVRMASAGAAVTAVDLCVSPKLSHSKVSSIQGDIRNIEMLTNGALFDVCSLQRTIHYLTYTQALALLQYLKKVVAAKLFVSVSGLESDIGLHYADANKQVTERFCVLDTAGAQTFFIHEPVCLYTPEEFIVLLQASGWEIDECWTSAFGNIKAVCS